MSDGSAHHHGLMEGHGAYNAHSAIQAAGGALAQRLLEQAAQDAEFGGESAPVLIANHGSSEGRNSVAPMRTAISTVRSRLGPERPILVAHNDQPTNDFRTLFEMLESRPGGYGLDDDNGFPCAIGRSFYRRVLPPASVPVVSGTGIAAGRSSGGRACGGQRQRRAAPWAIWIMPTGRSRTWSTMAA